MAITNKAILSVLYRVESMLWDYQDDLNQSSDPGGEEWALRRVSAMLGCVRNTQIELAKRGKRASE